MLDSYSELKRTPLYRSHLRAGAKLAPFAGWEMPVQYEGVKAEHLAVRATAGVFDVSHMGEIETTGPRALEFLQAHLTNDLSKVPLWGAQYALLCREDGGILDDLITYRLPAEDGSERFLLVVNAANVEGDLNWLGDRAAEWRGVEVVDRSSEYAMLALQGPRALSMLAGLWDGGDAVDLRRFMATRSRVAGIEALVCRTGYTGEDGVELLVAPESAAKLWQAVLVAGAKPAGLGARDTLRLEVCYPLYGADLLAERTPIEAGLKWCCALDKDFVGAEPMRRQIEQGTSERLAAFAIEGRGIPRQGCPVLKDGQTIGEVTSGTYSPSLEVGIGMAYLRSEFGVPGTAIDIDIRGKLRAAHVAEGPLYKSQR